MDSHKLKSPLTIVIQKGGVTKVVSQRWCHKGGVTKVVSQRWCHKGSAYQSPTSLAGDLGE